MWEYWQDAVGDEKQTFRATSTKKTKHNQPSHYFFLKISFRLSLPTFFLWWRSSFIPPIKTTWFGDWLLRVVWQYCHESIKRWRQCQMESTESSNWNARWWHRCELLVKVFDVFRDWNLLAPTPWQLFTHWLKGNSAHSKRHALLIRCRHDLLRTKRCLNNEMSERNNTEQYMYVTGLIN